MLVLGIAAGLFALFMAAAFGKRMGDKDLPSKGEAYTGLAMVMLLQVIALALAYWAGAV